MPGFMETLLLSAMMGFSIYLSLPVLLHRRTGQRTTKLLTAVATGILIFLIGDIFSDVAGYLNNGSLYGYGTSSVSDAVFAASFAAGFLVLYYAENRSKLGLTPTLLSLMIALGIGFQNLTEGLVFGALGASFGLTGGALVVLVGFTLQNVTEGFPIASPFFGRTDMRTPIILIAFFIGGIPTLVGGAFGFFHNSGLSDVAFDGLAIGSILYVLLPMFKSLFRESDAVKQRIAYAGVFLGFVIGFLVNLV